MKWFRMTGEQEIDLLHEATAMKYVKSHHCSKLLGDRVSCSTDS